MSTLFKAPYPVTVHIDNEKYPTSHFFRGGQYTDIVMTGPEPENVSVWCDIPVTKNIAVNSKFLSGEVKLNFYPLARDGCISNGDEFQRYAFTRPAEILEIVSSLIRQGLVEKKKEGEPPVHYIMYTKEAYISFCNNSFGWQINFCRKTTPLRKKLVSMYEIGVQCTVISLAK